MIDASTLSIGMRASVGVRTVRAVAPIIEELGFRGLWLSDSADGDALEGLAAAAEVTSVLHLATGVIPLDRRPVAEFTDTIDRLPVSRLSIGIGSGSPRGALARVEASIAELRKITAAPIVVGALGPMMRRLAAEQADGVLLNWLTPAVAALASADLRMDRGSRDARAVIYVRTIVDERARPALDSEIARKSGRETYAANAARTRVNPRDAAIDGTRHLSAALEDYANVVDEVVLRAVTAEPTAGDYAAFVRSVARRLD